MAYLRKVADGALDTLITRQRHDTLGRLIEQWDPRLSRPNLTSVYRLSGEALRVDSVDAGWRLSLAGVAGEILQHWDQRASHWRTTYDRQLRVIAVEENAQPNVETLTYADAFAVPGLNLRGHLIKQTDPSGSLEFRSFNLRGLPFEETRTFLDDKAYTTTWQYGASGQPLSQSDAAGHQQHSRYDIAGQLKQAMLQVTAVDPQQDVFKDAQYNAAGQIITQLAGNDVLSTWTYDPANGRLCRLMAQKNLEPPLQEFEYFYDRMGNVTRIDDLAFTPSHFANQRIDGHREFTYDSLYRLTNATGYDDAPPSDNPGRPGPTDPKDRRNYTQTYTYDTGGNLIKLNHVRDGASDTREMFIDPNSNRGVRWGKDDPPPVFDDLFDRHGNLRALQPGQPLYWNSRDQLESVTLVTRENDSNDEERYRYSQGVRVYKRHETHTASTTHFHEVRYLPGLEIRTRDTGEELHVITLPGGRGAVRCLHWVSGKPAGIEADQLRYSLDDHLGSSLMELDQQARLISHEGYYPFGETAWLTANSELEVSYKTIRYSGKEMDVSGLYYYGARYYAPWLQRWVSADPVGDVDGLNLYGFVGNNPLGYIDHEGGMKIPFAIIEQTKASFANGDESKKFDLQIYRHLEILSEITMGVRDVTQQILNHRSATEHALSSAKRTGSFLMSKGTSTAVGAGVGALLGTPGGPPLMLLTGAAGALVGVGAGKTMEYIGKKTGLNTSVSLKSGRLNLERIRTEVYSKTSDRYIGNTLAKYSPATKSGLIELASAAVPAAMGLIPYVGKGLSAIPKTIDILKEVDAAGGDLTPEQINELDTDIENTIGGLERGKSRLMEKAEKFNRQEILGYTPQRIAEKTDKRIKSLNDLRTILHSRSSKFTSV
ncbi:RHS repeat-associated core domain-containing protein [Pseudomonas brassicacearum]|uniref:RHS repeat-associated core domain-containing protein n=1 Tax=Pseudomonas brassicacearum TaxID=930166 RepID=UPI002882D762|nr:RHS repeat-associated core domain-containing protein [Pseudomonas brassicacearum]